MTDIARGYDKDVLTEELNSRVVTEWSGSKACYECHPGFESVWAKQGHFKSYETISDAKALDDRSCTRCHALGYNKEPRLLTYDLIPDSVREVGCEGCHPDGERHVTLQKQLAAMTPEARANATITDPIKNPAEGSMCLTCHTGKSGVGFDPVAAIAAAKEICMSVPNPTVTPPPQSSQPPAESTPPSPPSQ